MGNSVQVEKPYIVDEYESDDDLPYESATETCETQKLDQTSSDNDSKSGETDEELLMVKANNSSNGQHLSTGEEAKKLGQLLEVLNSCSTEAAQKAAAILRENLVKTPEGDVPHAVSVNHNEEKLANLNTTPECSFDSSPEHGQLPRLDGKMEPRSCQVTLSCDSFTQSKEVPAEKPGDLDHGDDEQKRNEVLAKLDQDLNQFETAEAEIAKSMTQAVSNIPNPRPSLLPRSRRDNQSFSESSGDSRVRRSSGERLRRVSPLGGNSRIPRYGGSSQSATYARVSSSSLESETERITLDVCPTEVN